MHTILTDSEINQLREAQPLLEKTYEALSTGEITPAAAGHILQTISNNVTDIESRLGDILNEIEAGGYSSARADSYEDVLSLVYDLNDYLTYLTKNLSTVNDENQPDFNRYFQPLLSQ